MRESLTTRHEAATEHPPEISAYFVTITLFLLFSYSIS